MLDTLRTLQSADRLEIELGSEHMVTLALDNEHSESSKDLRPVLPLIINCRHQNITSSCYGPQYDLRSKAKEPSAK